MKNEVTRRSGCHTENCGSISLEAVSSSDNICPALSGKIAISSRRSAWSARFSSPLHCSIYD
jgi:hypothetical protein